MAMLSSAETWMSAETVSELGLAVQAWDPATLEPDLLVLPGWGPIQAVFTVATSLLQQKTFIAYMGCTSRDRLTRV